MEQALGKMTVVFTTYRDLVMVCIVLGVATYPPFQKNN